MAKASAATTMAETIINHHASAPCSSCSQLEKELQKKMTVIEELNNQIEDLKSSVNVKRAVITNLEEENKKLKQPGLENSGNMLATG